MPASWRATCGASSSELTRASTAIDAGVDARLVEPRPHDVDGGRRAGVGIVEHDPQRPGRAVGVRSGPDLLGDPAVVVAEQRAARRRPPRPGSGS